MKYTKQNFERFAEYISDRRRYVHGRIAAKKYSELENTNVVQAGYMLALEDLENHLVAEFSDSPKFDAKRFRKACGSNTADKAIGARDAFGI